MRWYESQACRVHGAGAMYRQSRVRAQPAPERQSSAAAPDHKCANGQSFRSVLSCAMFPSIIDVDEESIPQSAASHFTFQPVHSFFPYLSSLD